VWDSYQQRFVDVFTCADLVDIVLFTHRTLAASAAGGGDAGSSNATPRGEAQHAIERCQLRDLHGLKRSKPSGFMMASVDDSVHHGCLLLKQHRLECLPLGDTASSSSLLHLLLPEQLLAFVVASPDLQLAAAPLFAATLAQSVLPHLPAQPRTIRANDSLSAALTLLSEAQLTSLPVVNESGQLCDVLASSDVRHLATNSLTDDLTIRVDASLGSLPPTPQRLHTCTPNDTLGSAIQRLANLDVAQLVCVDASGAVMAVVGCSDVLIAFLEPAALSPVAVQ